MIRIPSFIESPRCTRTQSNLFGVSLAFHRGLTRGDYTYIQRHFIGLGFNSKDFIAVGSLYYISFGKGKVGNRVRIVRIVGDLREF